MLPSLQPRPFQMLRCIVCLEQMSFQRFQGVPGVGFLGIFHGAMSFKGGQEALSKASWLSHGPWAIQRRLYMEPWAIQRRLYQRHVAQPRGHAMAQSALCNINMTCFCACSGVLCFPSNLHAWVGRVSWGYFHVCCSDMCRWATFQVKLQVQNAPKQPTKLLLGAICTTLKVQPSKLHNQLVHGLGCKSAPH